MVEADEKHKDANEDSELVVEVVGRGRQGWLKWLQSLDRPCLELLFREVANKRKRT